MSLFAKMLFFVALIIVMFIPELSGFVSQVLQVFKFLKEPEAFIESAVKAFDIRIPPGFIERNEDNLDTEVQAKSGQFSKGFGMVQAAAERGFVIKLQVFRQTVCFPVVAIEHNDTFSSFRPVLI